MSKVYRSVGAFLLAAIVASGIVLTPATARADDLTAYCSLLANAIDHLNSRPNPPQHLVDYLQGLYDTYCLPQ